MQTALQRSPRIMAVLSADYLNSAYASAEWFAAFARDPRGERRLLMPVRVDPCAVEGLLGQIVWIDLVGLGEAEAAARLLDGVREGRRKPQSAPVFPSAAKPVFPPLDRSNPYRGLAAFDAEHRDDFFGRGRYVEAVSGTLSRKGFACIVGASGSGKSSLLQAGLLPMLGDAGITTALCRPRGDPFAGLARALTPLLEPGLRDRGPLWIAAERYAARLREGPAALVRLLSELSGDGQGIVVAIDQLEELFTQTGAAERSAFIELLSCAWERSERETRWLISLRADFLDEALAFEPVRRMLQDATVLLGPMSEEELASAVVEPARRRSVQFEAGLPERILRDVGAGEAAGRLPLLQFALTELWLRQDGGVIRHAAYDDAAHGIGGIEGALRLHAERVYASFSEVDQARIRGLFRRLAQRGPGRSDIRRLVPRSEVENDWDLVAELARRRLLTVSEDGEDATVEVVHEALFRAWPALVGWIEEHRDFDLWRQQLGEQVARWNAAPAPARDDLLLRGALLDLALARSKERASELAPREADFIAQSAAARRRQGRRRAALVASAFAAVLAVAALAGLQWLRAEEERACRAGHEGRGRTAD